MITNKQRAALRSQSNGMETIFQIGKGGISDMLVQQVEDALKAREMIKLRVLESARFSRGKRRRSWRKNAALRLYR